MIFLTVNAGSSSVKLDLYRVEGSHQERLHSAQYDSTRFSHEHILNDFMNIHEDLTVSVISHRIVHGGDLLLEPALLDNETMNAFEQILVLAPLHNANALKLIKACTDIFGSNCMQVAVPDTGFYRKLPDVAKYYALPKKLSQRYGIRRFGFHGFAHQSMWNSWHQQNMDNSKNRVISIQLGSGCSVTAIHNGAPVDTSMGFTPMEGLMMSTRCGDLDVGITTFLQKSEGMDSTEIERILNEESGLLGVSGISGDMRELMKSNHANAKLAIAMYCYRVKKYIGAYIAILGGVDAILFGGGVGENVAEIRRKILADMQWCGIAVNEAVNNTSQGILAEIHAGHSRVEIWVIPVDEAVLLVQVAKQMVPNYSAAGVT